MYNTFMNKWCEYSKEASKPWLELMELNLQTFNQWTKQAKSMQEFSQTRSPEDLYETQKKIGTEAVQAWNEYLQKLTAIYVESASHFGNLFQNISEDVYQKTSENINKTHENIKKYKNE